MTLPTFFLAGAPKAGTDLLYYQLDQHPEIYMCPLKEPNFFADEVRPQNFDPSLAPQVGAMEEDTRKYVASGAQAGRFGGIVSTRSDYEKLFAGAREETAIGEGSVCYLWSRSAASRIAQLIPGAKIVLVLMDPAERACHQYLKSLSDRNVEHSFSIHLDLGFADLALPSDQLRLFNPFLAFGAYAEQLNRYFDCFPREQLFISLYEDRQPDYQDWFARLLRFLGVQPDFVPAPVDVPSTPRFADGQAPKLAPEDRARLVAYYRDDILRLQDRIERDLSSWLK